MAGKRDFVSMRDVRDDLVGLLELAGSIKNRTKAGEPYEPLRGRSLAMILEKSSTRTRVSFEVGMTQLGGTAPSLTRITYHWAGEGRSPTPTAALAAMLAASMNAPSRTKTF